MSGVDIIDTIFENCNLKLSEIVSTKLIGFDLSNSNIEKIKIDAYSIKCAFINQFQAIDIINLLGVLIK